MSLHIVAYYQDVWNPDLPDDANFVIGARKLHQGPFSAGRWKEQNVNTPVLRRACEKLVKLDVLAYDSRKPEKEPGPAFKPGPKFPWRATVKASAASGAADIDPLLKLCRQLVEAEGVDAKTVAQNRRALALRDIREKFPGADAEKVLAELIKMAATPEMDAVMQESRKRAARYSFTNLDVTKATPP